MRGAPANPVIAGCFARVSNPRDNDEQPVTVIVPASAAGCGARSVRASRGSKAGLRWLAIGVLCVMLLALVAVVYVLPDLVAEREQRAPSAPLTEPQRAPRAAPSEDDRSTARDKREADRLLGLALRAKTELEAEGVAVWGGTDYDAALDRLAAGDAELDAQRYLEAAQEYTQTLSLLEALRAGKAERLAAALAAGEAALDAGDGPTARASFEIALAVEPQNARAQQGMLRARVFEEVSALIASGADDEARDALEDARDRYAEALTLDPRSQDARDALETVTARIRARDFQLAMSAALGALEDGDFNGAQAALTRAESLAPGSPEVADARVRLERARQRARIADHRHRAERLEREEHWREAAEHYAAVLAIDSNAAFARSGEHRSLARERIHEELDAYLAAPARLHAEELRESAHRLIAAVGDLDAASEPLLAEKLARLAEATEIAGTPMRVELESDNLTDVTVYKVGRFGRFERRQIMLTPGTYVVVGTRAGYRDVRVEFTLTAGQDPALVSVRCREKI